jgi:ketosteroid isomerase-like protein
MDSLSTDSKASSSVDSRGDGETKAEVMALVTAFFDVGKSKDLTTLTGFHAPPHLFSKFDENPPFTRQSSDEAFMYEQAGFANISDYDYKIEEPKIDLVGGVAIVTFYLSFTGVFVNDYSFEGQTVGSRSRVTMVLSKFGGRWKIVHAHLSSFPGHRAREEASAGRP